MNSIFFDYTMICATYTPPRNEANLSFPKDERTICLV